MSVDTTDRLGLPMIETGQAAKELTHNEALALLDIAVQASVIAVGMNEPPAAPQPGDAWVLGTAPTGAWAGQAMAIAAWTPGGWRFVAPREGMRVWVTARAFDARFVAGTWVSGELRSTRLLVDGVPVVGRRAAAIPEPQDGVTVDGEARATLTRILDTLRDHGLIAM